MIDVLLVLLVFFVAITSTEVLKVDKNLTLPVSPNAKPRDPEQAKHEMALNVRMDQATEKAILVMDDRIFEDWQEVINILQARKETDPDLRIIIRGDAKLPASEVERVMTLVGESGLSDIAFAASNR